MFFLQASQNSNFSEKPDQDSASDKKTILMDEINKITDQLDQISEEGPIEKVKYFVLTELFNHGIF